MIKLLSIACLSLLIAAPYAASASPTEASVSHQMKTKKKKSKKRKPSSTSKKKKKHKKHKKSHPANN